jgi:hypothetical protein
MAAVRFDQESASLWADGHCLEEAAMGNREYGLLCDLWPSRNWYVTYTDLMHFMVEHSRSRSSIEEAKFWHKLRGEHQEDGATDRASSRPRKKFRASGCRLQ